MTTYQTNASTTTTAYREPSGNRGGIKIDNTAPGSLAGRTQKTTGSSRSGSYGSGSKLSGDGKNNISPFARSRNNISPFRKPQNATQARRISGSSNGSSSNARQSLGRAARTASSVAGAVGRRVAPVVGVNAKGEIDFGLRAGGFGVSASVTGRVSVSALSNTVTWKPGDKDDWSVESGFGLWSQDSTRNGCSVVITTRFNGKIISQQVREADDCREPDPTPEPTPTPTPTPKPPNEGEEPRRTASPMPPIPFEGLAEVWSVYNGVHFNQAHMSNVRGFYCNGDETMVTIDFPYDNDWKEYDKKFTLIPVQRWSDKTGWYTIWEPSEHLARYRRTIFRIYDSGEDTNGTDNYMPLGNNLYWQIGYMDAEGNMIQIGEGERLFSWYYKQVPPVNLPPPNKRRIPKVNEECDCELLGKIYDMLGGDDYYENGLIIPNKLYVPQGTGGTKAMNYNGLFNLLFRTLDHRTVGDVKVVIPDNNKMMKGNQKLEFVAVNATGAFNKLLELAFDNQGDNGAQLNLTMRMSYMLAQILRMAVIISEAVKSLLGFFNVPISQKVEQVDIPIDISLGSNIGKEPKQPSKEKITKILDLDDPEKTESILDKFMNLSKMPVTVSKFIKSSKGGDYWWFLNKNRK